MHSIIIAISPFRDSTSFFKDPISSLIFSEILSHLRFLARSLAHQGWQTQPCCGVSWRHAFDSSCRILFVWSFEVLGRNVMILWTVLPISKCWLVIGFKVNIKRSKKVKDAQTPLRMYSTAYLATLCQDSLFLERGEGVLRVVTKVLRCDGWRVNDLDGDAVLLGGYEHDADFQE